MISKKEQIWRYILEGTLSKNRVLEFEQRLIAEKLMVSTSTVFNALRIPRQSGAVKVGGRKFTVTNISKLLTIWATHRNISRDVVYQTYIDESIGNAESSMPPNTIFGAYTAYKLRYKDAPADYDKLYVYTTRKDLENIKQRFPFHKKPEFNVFVLEADEYLSSYGDIIPNSQLYADLWNMSDWYAHDFLEALKKQLHI